MESPLRHLSGQTHAFPPLCASVQRQTSSIASYLCHHTAISSLIGRGNSLSRIQILHKPVRTAWAWIVLDTCLPSSPIAPMTAEVSVLPWPPGVEYSPYKGVPSGQRNHDEVTPRDHGRSHLLRRFDTGPFSLPHPMHRPEVVRLPRGGDFDSVSQPAGDPLRGKNREELPHRHPSPSHVP